MDDRCTESRPKRQKIDKSGRSAALERLKALKGRKNKCEIGEVDNVYEYVDEKEYAKRVRERQDEDWLENPGDGYFEDGREIFDSDDEEHDFNSSASKKSKKLSSLHKKKEKKTKSVSNNILDMVSKMPAKKRNINSENNILNLLEESLNSASNSSSQKSEVLTSKEYLKMLSHTSNQNITKKIKNENVKPMFNSAMEKNLIKLSVNKKSKYENFDENSPVKVTSYSDSACVQNVLNEETLNESSIVSNDVYDDSINFDDNMDVDLDDIDLNISADSTKTHKENSQNSAPNMDKDCNDEFLNSIPLDNKEEISSISSEWVDNDTPNLNVPLLNISVDKSNLPLSTNTKGEKVFRFFWWDAYEDSIKQPGIVYLFGKVYYEPKKIYLSCCVAVENIPRRIFLLPRDKKFDLKTNESTETEISLLDVYKEFNENIATPNKIMNFKSRKTTLKYAFELNDVPAESEYLEIKYPATYAKLSQDLSGETFSRVFGTNTSSLEVLLLDRKIKGPCWLEIKNPQTVNVQCSWCKLEVRCSKPEDVIISDVFAPPPPLTLMAINIRTVVSKNMDNEIVMIGVIVNNQYKIDKPAPNPPFNSHFCTVTRSPSCFWPQNIEKCLGNYKKTEVAIHQAEKSLLNHFLTKLFTIDPDVIIGHEIFGFTLDTLIQRIQHLKIPNWSRIGRLKRAILPQFKGKQIDKSVTCGRLVCDVVTSARELIRARSYDLSTLCKQILGIEESSRQDFSSEEVVEKFQKVGSILELINCTMEDTSHILKIVYEINALPLALQITKIAGNVMSKTLSGGRSERNEFLLLHAFTEKNYLVPDKCFSKKPRINEEEIDASSKNNKKKPQYAGGLVFEPKKGFYDKFILLMDFNSLYPSIIQEYNICFTTVSRGNSEDENEINCPADNLPLGILPIEIKKLVETRREVKQLMKSPNLPPDLYMQHNIRQMALKLTANSMYGCLGFSYSRFYAKPLAALVTSKGREILLNTKNIVEKMNYDVIYGDTDSVMINTNCINYDEVFTIGHKIKDEINRLYKYIELDVDGVFKYMLLLKKKKYAAVVLTKKPSGELIASKEYKGLDIVRRDWCQLSAEVGRHILNQILSDLSPEDRIGNIKDHLERITVDLRDRKVPISLLAITKQLAKNPEDYSDIKSLPHLQVALRMNSKGGKKLRIGNTVSYVICDDGSNLPPLQRAYHVDELKSNSQLLIDIKYYLEQQIHPVISRLCEPVDGVDAAFVAECLGLDPASYRKAIHKAEKDENENNAANDYMLVNDLEAFKRCEVFSFVCKGENCGTVNFIDSPMRDNIPALSKCRNPSCNTSPITYLTNIVNELTIKMKTHIRKFYQNWLICEDPACTNRTQRVPMKFSSTFPVCNLCNKGAMYREYTSSDLYYQIKYYKHVFTLEKKNYELSEDIREAYKTLQEKVSNVLNMSAYNSLDLGKMFSKSSRKKRNDRKLQNSFLNLKI